MDLIKIKNFYSEKDIIKRMRRDAIAWEKLFEKYISDNELLSNIYKNTIKTQ